MTQASLVRALLVFGCLVVGVTQLRADEARVVPLPNAHAHNDYEHQRPLLDALDHGFCSVEADIHLVNGELLVAHDRLRVKAERTLQALYLDPLRKRVRENGGKVYKNGPEFTLLIDVKSNAEGTYAVLREVLKQYSDILTEFHPDRTRTKAVTVIISGDRAIQTMAAEQVRYAGVDGRLSDLEGKINRNLMPLVSESWFGNFGWFGAGPIPEKDRKRLEEVARKAHENKVRLRFWATPDNPVFWRTLREKGVDLLNSDNLAKLQEFLLAEKTK